MGREEGEAETGTGDTVARVALQQCWEMSTNKEGQKEHGGFSLKQCAASWSEKLKREECFGSD